LGLLSGEKPQKSGAAFVKELKRFEKSGEAQQNFLKSTMKGRIELFTANNSYEP
jgi:hypothetical protein